MTGQVIPLFGGLLTDFADADMVIANLECPLVSCPSPIAKIGPVLAADPACLATLKKAGITVLSLANNHILDHGENGVRSTLTACRAYGFDTVGVGETLEEAQKPLSYNIGDVKLAVLAMAEDEMSLAGTNSCGANPIDHIHLAKSVALIKQTHDVMVIIIHGGSEYNPYPSPRTQKLSRFLIDQGADLIIWQHSHCAGAIESYRGGSIVYGQGNFIFDVQSESVDWHRGFLVDFRFSKTESSELSIIPFTQSHGHPGIRRMDSDMEREFRQHIASISEHCADPNFVATQWRDYCTTYRDWYVAELCGYSRIVDRYTTGFPFLNQRLLALLGVREEMLLKFINLVECEAHHEMMITILYQYLEILRMNSRNRAAS